MDKQRRKELIGEYKTRRSEMGVVAYVCTETGEMFLSAAKDTKADINSTLTKLESGFHPNKRLLELWNEYGREGFDISVAETLEYKDGVEDYAEDLEVLRDEVLEHHPGAQKVWR